MRIAVLSDIHANIVALEAVLAAAGPLDAIWHLGDVVGYGPAPDEVVARLAELGAIGVLGNHDAVAIGDEEPDLFNVDARRAIEWTRDAIAPETRRWLAALPETLVEGDVTLVHGSPREPRWEYVLSASTARDNLGAFATRLCLHGHTHVPVAFRSDGRAVRTLSPGDGTRLELGTGRSLLNPGSVGQPRDGDPRAAYAILDLEADELAWHRVAYDIAATQRAMERLGLPPRLVSRLDHGI